jgi:hypothetical protein
VQFNSYLLEDTRYHLVIGKAKTSDTANGDGF